MSLVEFDETNQEHLEAFNYFANGAEHCLYKVGDVVEDFNLAFREYIFDNFKESVPHHFIDDQNGCFHELLQRNKNEADFIIYYEYDSLNDDRDYEDDDEHHLEDTCTPITFSGKLFFDDDSGEIVLEPYDNTIKFN